MKISSEFLKKKFKDYYAKTMNTATHVFVYSNKQRNAGAKVNYVNGIPYSEMRSRDANSEFMWDDIQFIAVGTYSDVKAI